MHPRGGKAEPVGDDRDRQAGTPPLADARCRRAPGMTSTSRARSRSDHVGQLGAPAVAHDLVDALARDPVALADLAKRPARQLVSSNISRSRSESGRGRPLPIGRSSTSARCPFALAAELDESPELICRCYVGGRRKRKSRYSYVYALSSRKYEQSRGFEGACRGSPPAAARTVSSGDGERRPDAHLQCDAAERTRTSTPLGTGT